MPSRREQIRMSPDEVRAYLEAQRRIVVVTSWDHAKLGEHY